MKYHPFFPSSSGGFFFLLTLSSLFRVSSSSLSSSSSPPNLIFLLTDDQDIVFNSTSVMPNVQKYLYQQGLWFTNAFVDVSVCCPSRTSTLSGRYAHNLQDTTQGWCGNFGKVYENRTWIRTLQTNGYATGLFGKYYNDYGNFCDKNIHIPQGWDRWYTICTDNAYFNISYNDQGKMVTSGDAPSDYMTSKIGNATINWLQSLLQNTSNHQPFFAYIAPHAPHVPSTPAPWYANTPVPSEAPRVPNWNTGNLRKHWLVDQQPNMSTTLIDGSDRHYGNRLRSLISVDDILGEVMALLSSYNQLENTYIIYSSDHGYSLGNFRLAAEKYHVYDNNIRIPFFVRGPGVPSGSIATGMVNNVDIGNTLLDLAGLPLDNESDGKSFKSLILSSSAASVTSNTDTFFVDATETDYLNNAIVNTYPEIITNASRYISSSLSSSSWRDRLLIEYWGLGYVERGPCTNFVSPCPGGASQEALLDAPSNTYVGLRIINSTHNLLYAEFRPSPSTYPDPSLTNFTEVFDLSNDPYQLNNLWPNGLPAATLKTLQEELYTFVACQNTTCP